MHHSRLPVVAVAEVVVGAEIPLVATVVAAAVVEVVVGAEIPPVVTDVAAAVVDIEIAHGAVVAVVVDDDERAVDEIVVVAVDRQVVVGTRVAVHNFPSFAPLPEGEDAYLSEHRSA